MSSKKKREEYLRALPERFSGFSGIDEIEINPLTGSVLFKHKGNSEDIIDFVQKRGIFEITIRSVQPPSVHHGVSSIYQELDRTVRSFSNGSTNAGGLAFVGLLAYGVIQIGRGNIAGPPWYTAFWYAMNIFLKSQSRQSGEMALDEIAPDIDAE